MKDLSGMRSGRLVAIRPTDKKTANNRIVWECKCDCGNTHFVSYNNLISGHVKSCGCLVKEMRETEKAKRYNFIGNRYGKLVIVDVAGTDKNRNILYLCKCDCGNETICTKRALISGNTTSCGCVGYEMRLRNVKFKKYDTQEKNTRLSLLNQKNSIRNTTGVKGVCKYKNGRFGAYITLKGEHIYLGTFKNIEDATQARKDAEKEYFEPVLKKHGRALKGGVE